MEHVLEPRPVAVIEASCVPIEKLDDRGSIDAAARHAIWKALTGAFSGYIAGPPRS